MQRRRQQGQHAHGTARSHTVKFLNAFSLLSDSASAHLPDPPPPGPSRGPVAARPGADRARARRDTGRCTGQPARRPHSPCTQPYSRLRLHRHAQHMLPQHLLHDGGESGCAVTADANPLHRLDWRATSESSMCSAYSIWAHLHTCSTVCPQGAQDSSYATLSSNRYAPWHQATVPP